MASIPASRTWAAGETPTASMLNTELRANWGFFTNRPKVKVYNTSGQTVTATETPPGSGAWNSNDILMTWNAEIYDNDGMFNVGSSNSRLTVVTTGAYEVMLHINWAIVNDPSPGNRYTAVKLNAGGAADLDTSLTNQIGNDTSRCTNSSTVIPQTSHVSFQYYFNAGDYIEACCGGSFPSQTTIVGGAAQRTFFGMRWIGAS